MPNLKQMQMKDKYIEKAIFHCIFALPSHYPRICLCKHVNFTANREGKLGGIWALHHTTNKANQSEMQ